MSDEAPILLSRAIERNVIACMLTSLDCLEAVVLPPAAFEAEPLRITYQLVKELQAAGNTEVSISTLRTFFDQREDFAQTLQEHGGWQFLENLAAKPDMANFKVHREELERRLKVRETRAKAGQALEEVMSANLRDPKQVYDILDAHMQGDDLHTENENLSSDELNPEWLAEQTRKWAAGEFEDVGIPVLNEHMRRIMGDQLVHGSLLLLAGETNVGKSQWIQLLVRHFTFHQGIPTLIFDNELSKREITYRILSNIAGIPMRTIFNGSAFDPKGSHYSDMKRAVEALERMPVQWRKLLDMSIERMDPIVRRFLRSYPKDQYPHKLIVVDGIKMQSSSESSFEVGFFGQRLKDLSSRYEQEGVVVLPTCQLNRQGTAKATAEKKDLHPDHNSIGLSKLLADNADDVYILLKHPEIDGHHQKTYSKYHRRLVCTKARNHSTFEGSNYVLMDFDGPRCYLEPTASVGPEVEQHMPPVSTSGLTPVF